MPEHLPVDPATVQRRKQLAIAIPIAIYLFCTAVAFAIHGKFSCRVGSNFYTLLGLASLLVHFIVQLVLDPRMHVFKRFLRGLLASAIGVLVWTWGLDAAGLSFMCF